MPIRVALISNAPGWKESLTEKLSIVKEFEIVYRGEDFSTNTKMLVDSNPDIVIVAPGEHKKLNPRRFELLTEKSPNTKAILVTKLDKNSRFVRESVSYGAHVLNSRYYPEIVGEIRRLTREGQPKPETEIQNFRRSKER